MQPPAPPLGPTSPTARCTRPLPVPGSQLRSHSRPVSRGACVAGGEAGSATSPVCRVSFLAAHRVSCVLVSVRTERRCSPRLLLWAPPRRPCDALARYQRRARELLKLSLKSCRGACVAGGEAGSVCICVCVCFCVCVWMYVCVCVCFVCVFVYVYHPGDTSRWGKQLR